MISAPAARSQDAALPLANSLAEPAPAAPDAAHFAHDITRVPVFRPQAKLTVSQPGDPLEQEADRTADEVMRSEAPAAAEQDKSSEQDRASVSASLSGAVMRAPGDTPPPASPPPDPNTSPTDPNNPAIPLGPTGTGSTTITPNPTTRTLSAPNLSQLWDVMTRSGTRESASVLPKMTPNPQYEYDGNNKVTKATITVVETKEMPQWTELPNQCPPIQAEWNRFYAVLDTHENNHIAIDKKHFTNLHARLIGKEQSVAWKMVDDEITAADTENQTYDTTSDHGVKEGAKINSWVQCAPEKIKSTSAGGPDDDNAAPNVDPGGAAPGLPPTMQAKLTVSQAGDPLEREADTVADRVMRTEAPMVQRECAGPGKCDCPKCRQEQEEKLARAGEGSAVTEDAAPLVQSVVGSTGQPLDTATREFMEPRFGHDFSRVRIHADTQASRSAEAVSARAYAIGPDIAFRSGEYQPGTSEGKRLLAHELTHTIQQGAALRQVMRDPNFTPAPANTSPASAPPPASAPAANVPASAKTVTYKGHTLYGDPAAAKTMIDKMLATDGYKTTLEFLDDLSTLTTRDADFNAAFKPEQNTEANLCVNTTAGVRASVVKAHEDLLTEFPAEAKKKAGIILTESEKRINAERERYGLPAPKTMHDRDSGGNIDLTPHTMADNDETKKMAAAAALLIPPRKTLEGLMKQYDGCLQSNANNNSGPGMPTKSVIPGKESEAQDLETKIQEARRQLNIDRAQKEGEFPILAAYGAEGEANTASLENIARGAESQGWKFWKSNAADELAPMIAEKLHNIQTVRDALAGGQLNIWNNATLVSGAKGDLGYGPSSWQSKVVDDKVKEVHDDEFLVNLLVGALALGLGLVAIFATAGTATAAVATVGSAVVSTGQAANSLGNYMLAQAEAGTDFEKARSISQEDPSLIWLAIDIVAAILDVKAATASFKVLGPVIREAIAAGKTPEWLEKLGAILEKYGGGLKQRVLAHIGGAVDTGKPALEELEKVARAQYKALSDAGRLKEIGEVSEEVFVKQMTSGAHTQIVISGEEGVRRTNMLTGLMQPGNERIAAILKGDAKAIDGLIMEHGNWKQLMGMLDQGTPEMRQAAAKLFDRRASVLGELESKFHAKPVSGASSEKISDIDLSTYGENAGADMIAAEKHMAGLYGPGWSEALRMNFYTEAGRLTLYEKIMPGLSKADQAAVLGQISGEAEKLNIAKMLAHAEGDPARLAEVEAYASKIGVDIKDPKIQELVPKLAGGGDVAARNKTLLEIDDLMKKYNAAAPGSPEQIDLAKTITSKQMEVNAMTAEAYVGPGAGRMTVSGVKVIGQEAYQAALSNLEMIQHIMHQCGGDVVTATREYEIYKYINRFSESAVNAGAKTPGLDYWEHFSGFVSKTERQGASDAVHLGPRPNATVPKGGQPFLPDSAPTIGPVTDQFLQQQYAAWNDFSQQALGDLKKIASENPGAWTPFNSPLPAAGAPPPAPK
ncbi:hypothetical protein CCAX7_24340 [Capsulimonas corticalis]|uniref:eCIS core domain-containing protein n=2 Tax=Capsulimonas corticalis TaxID=2219043 RepID=A0A402CVF2_9BACT|nr:hypothetical protein CCAX7_24340 [Capsulimonas corticalis]